MKFWELEEGKIYVDSKSSYKYKLVNHILLYYSNINYKWCESCSKYNYLITLDFKEVEREIDWDKVSEDTKVQVLAEDLDTHSPIWINMYFISYNELVNFPFFCSPTKEKDDNFTGYKRPTNHFLDCRIHPSVEIPEDWYKDWGGEVK